MAFCWLTLPPQCVQPVFLFVYSPQPHVGVTLNLILSPVNEASR